MSQTRRLAAILAADVAGYSRLMGVDEEGTHERLKAHFRELVDPKIEEHHGRTVKTLGTACWWSLRAWLMLFGAPLKSNAAWSTASPRCPRTCGLGSASASISAT
jgi:class 3 adenylate cyclase